MTNKPINELEPVAYILCYTDRDKEAMDDTSDTDYFEVFPEVGKDGLSPFEQAENRLKQIESEYDADNATHELYTWNIAAIVKSNEWYGTGNVI